jgi:hypothetical protein
MKELERYTDTFVDMSSDRKYLDPMVQRYGKHKACCEGKKCVYDPVKCGFSTPGIILAGVTLPAILAEKGGDE